MKLKILLFLLIFSSCAVPEHNIKVSLPLETIKRLNGEAVTEEDIKSPPIEFIASSKWYARTLVIEFAEKPDGTKVMSLKTTSDPTAAAQVYDTQQDQIKAVSSFIISQLLSNPPQVVTNTKQEVTP